MGQRIDEGFEYDNGDLVYDPHPVDGSIQIRDLDGDSLGLYRLDDEEWPDLAKLFDLTRDDFPFCERCEQVHRRDQHVVGAAE